MQRLATWSKLRFGVEAMKATALVAALIATAVALPAIGQGTVRPASTGLPIARWIFQARS